MPLSALEAIAIITAAVFGPEYLILRGKEKAIGIFADSLMCGCIGIGVLTYAVLPVTYAGVVIFPSYVPHAYNLILWPLLALLILRPRFGPSKMLVAFAFCYALDEVAWNGLALLRYGLTPDAFAFPNGVLWFMADAEWRVFFGVMVLTVLASYLYLRPSLKMRKNAGLVTLVMYGLFWAFVANLASGAVNWYTLAFELFWQISFWLFIASTVFPRQKP